MLRIKLNILEPTIWCKATDYIKEQIELIKKLEEKGYTYEIKDDGIYFDTSKLKDYGKLAKLDVKGLKAGARIKLAEEMKKPVMGVIVTRVRNNSTEMPIANIQDMLELPILGIVPEDENIQMSVVMKDAIIHTHPKSKAARAYKKIAAKISGVDYKDKVSFFDMLLGRY